LVCVAIITSIAALSVIGAVTIGLAQESPTPVPDSSSPVTLTPSSSPSPTTPAIPVPSPTRSVRLSFVPPPIEGTISLGIYDSAGKLVRILDRESETDDFTIGHDALITEWDGKDNAGNDLPPGKYRARGYAVGSLGVEGIDYFFNDWVTDENSPHIKRIDDLSMVTNGLHLNAELSSGQHVELYYDLRHETLSSNNAAFAAIPPPRKDGARWVIAGSEVEQLSITNEIMRHLAYSPGDPQPKAVAADDQQEKIFVLEENTDRQRVRALTLVETKVDSAKQQNISDWKVEFEKEIVAHSGFALLDGKPVVSGGKVPPEKITVRLQPNPLSRDKRDSIEVAVSFDNEGSFLKTSDGLPLRTISDTPHLSRALVTTHGEKAIDVFQDDGAVVEQFRISNIDQMMAFDCGDFELK
jgi:hypothetical protein